MQCRLSQKELLMANYDESNLHQAGTKLSNPSQKRSKTLRTYTKVMNRTSRRRRSTRRKTETYSSGPAVFGSERSCMEDNNEKNGGPKNSCVKGILLKLSKLTSLQLLLCNNLSYSLVFQFLIGYS